MFVSLHVVNTIIGREMEFYWMEGKNQVCRSLFARSYFLILTSASCSPSFYPFERDSKFMDDIWNALAQSTSDTTTIRVYAISCILNHVHG